VETASRKDAPTVKQAISACTTSTVNVDHPSQQGGHPSSPHKQELEAGGQKNCNRSCMSS
jgi:hypothetical protein